MHKGYNLYVTLGFYGSLITIFLVRFVGPNVPEWFPGGATLSDILYNIGLSYVVSWIFYFIVVYLPDTKNKTNMFPRVKFLSVDLYRKWSQMKIYMESESQITLNEKPSLEDVAMLCRHINPHSTAPVIGSFSKDLNGNVISHNLDWGGYIYLTTNQIVETAHKLFHCIPYVDTELLAKVTELLHSGFVLQSLDFFRVDVYRNAANQNIAFLSNELHSFYYLVNDIHDYINGQDGLRKV